MKKNIITLLLTLLGSFSISVFAKTDVCHLPEGKYYGRSIMIQEKTTGDVEQFVMELVVRPDRKIGGHIRLYDLSTDQQADTKEKLKKHYFFELTDCNSKTGTYKVSSPDIDGAVRVVNVNGALRELTLTGAINTYEEGLYGIGQWLYESFWQALNYEGYPEIDFRKIPMRLRREL